MSSAVYRYIYELCSFSNLSVTSPTPQLIFQPFCRFTYVTAHSPTLPLLHLRHSSFSNTSFASPTSQALHLIHLVSRPCSSSLVGGVRASLIGFSPNVHSKGPRLYGLNCPDQPRWCSFRARSSGNSALP